MSLGSKSLLCSHLMTLMPCPQSLLSSSLFCSLSFWAVYW